MLYPIGHMYFDHLTIQNQTICGLLAVLAVLIVILVVKRGKCPIQQEVELNNEVYKQLVELRALADSDRAFVFRFHNGAEFLPSHPAWRLSCTHEIVKPGVTYESAKLQGLLVSMIQGMIAPVLTGISSSSGVAVKDCNGCQSKARCAKAGKHVVVMQVDDMDGYCRYHLENQNNKTSVVCGIATDGKVYGLVGVDFCGVKQSEERLKEISAKLCVKTDIIQNLLQYRRLPHKVSACTSPDRPISV